ncbi:T9SS type A sorting domain-containing protein [uncultured Fluviicola sp.]|uniref:T9SS type A sorting domain-containing protein n=1 Tax=uncultured Fluviicola sp. TaxID=463303 RepID=UPI0025E973B8|nr:T9SS type A sorting domain-containing protein [uncultured Fluviicola sp.]
MRTTLFAVALLLAPNFANSQRILEITNGSWDHPNLSVETYKNFVVSGFTETNPASGLLTPTFKISTLAGAPLNTYYVDYPDSVFLMDFTIREATNTIILTGMTSSLASGTPYKMIIAEVDLPTGAPVQSSLEYTFNGNSMVPHQVICSESTAQVTVVGTEILGTVTSSNYATIPKYGFVLGVDLNNFNTILYPPIEMDLPAASIWDYDMLENITEVPGSGYFISGSCNAPGSGEQNLITVGTDYAGTVTFSNIVDNTNSRFAGSSVMYNAPLGVVFLLANNSVIHQFQIAICDPFTGIFLTPWTRHQMTPYPIGGGVDQNGFRLQQSKNNTIVVGGYLSAPFGALPQQLTPFQISMRDNLAFLAAKVYQSGNNSPLSPSYYEENGNSVFINTPDMIVYNRHSDRTYLVNQNTVNGGFDLNVSSLLKASKCEKLVPVTTVTTNPIIVGSGNFNPLPMYTAPYASSNPARPIQEFILCQSIAPTLAASYPDPTLSPNPANDLLNVTLDEEETIQDVVIYDMKGNRVLSQKANQRTINEMGISVGKLDQGAYILEITTKEGNTHRERFVKQ